MTRDNFDGIFKNIGNITPARPSSVYLSEGVHILTLRDTIMKKSEVKDTWFFIAEFVCQETTGDHSAGDLTKWIQDMSKPKPERALENVKAFCEAFDPPGKSRKIDGDGMLDIIHEGTLNNLDVIARGRNITTKRGTPFTTFSWEFCPNDTTLATMGLVPSKPAEDLELPF